MSLRGSFRSIRQNYRRFNRRSCSWVVLQYVGFYPKRNRKKMNRNRFIFFCTTASWSCLDMRKELQIPPKSTPRSMAEISKRRKENQATRLKKFGKWGKSKSPEDEWFMFSRSAIFIGEEDCFALNALDPSITCVSLGKGLLLQFLFVVNARSLEGSVLRGFSMRELLSWCFPPREGSFSRKVFSFVVFK